MANTLPAEPLLTPAQLGAYLGVPLATVYQWRTVGSGPRGFRVGRHTRYRLADVDAWLEQKVGDSAAKSAD